MPPQHFLEDAPVDPALLVRWDKRHGFSIGEPHPARRLAPRRRASVSPAALVRAIGICISLAVVLAAAAVLVAR